MIFFYLMQSATFLQLTRRAFFHLLFTLFFTNTHFRPPVSKFVPAFSALSAIFIKAYQLIVLFRLITQTTMSFLFTRKHRWTWSLQTIIISTWHFNSAISKKTFPFHTIKKKKKKKNHICKKADDNENCYCCSLKCDSILTDANNDNNNNINNEQIIFSVLTRLPEGEEHFWLHYLPVCSQWV